MVQWEWQSLRCYPSSNQLLFNIQLVRWESSEMSEGAVLHCKQLATGKQKIVHDKQQALVSNKTAGCKTTTVLANLATFIHLILC
jgi:hypothetical protein